MKKFNFRFIPLPNNRRLKTRENFHYEEDYQKYLESDEYQATLKYREEVRQSKIETVKTYLLLVPSAFILLTMLFGSWFVVGAGEIGVVTRFGEVKRVAESGLNLKIPLIEDVKIMETRVKKKETSSSAVTKDLQDVTTVVALNFSVDKDTALKLYKEVGLNYEENVIDPILHESVKVGTAQYDSESLITSRAEAKEKILKTVKDRLANYGIAVVDLNIVNLDFSATFNAAIEEKAVAQQQVEKAKQDLERTKVESEQKITQAKAEAEAQRLQQETLTDLMVKKMFIEKWSGQMPQYVGDGNWLLNMGQ